MKKPCEGCPVDQGALGYHDEAWCLEHAYTKECPPHQHYLGYQEGLAEAESRVKAREREIVAWLKQPEEGPARHIRQGRRRLTAAELEAWLQGKE